MWRKCTSEESKHFEEVYRKEEERNKRDIKLGGYYAAHADRVWKKYQKYQKRA